MSMGVKDGTRPLFDCSCINCIAYEMHNSLNFWSSIFLMSLNNDAKLWNKQNKKKDFIKIAIITMEKKSYSELQQQSLEETTFYMTSAIEIINDKFNDSSYAKNHPELLGAFMQTAAIANLESVLLNGLGNIEKAIDQIS